MRLSILLTFCVTAALLASDAYGRKLVNVKYEKLETFLSGTYRAIYHIELDLFKDDGSLLFSDWRLMKTTDGKTTETIVGSTTNGYREGKGGNVLFLYIYGFTQINSTNVAIVDFGNHCLRMLDRTTQTTTRLAGVCTSAGNINGKSGKFNYPWGVVIDPRDPNKLFVTDRSNNALRSVDITTGEISTVVTGLTGPRGLSWNTYKTSLLITNQHYIKEITFDVNGTVIHNVILAGSTTAGYSENSFNSARFNTPSEIAPLSKHLEIVADDGNSKLRILDTLSNRTVPVCLNSSASCDYLSTGNYAVLPVNNDVYIGYSKVIYKLTGFECWLENTTAYIPAYSNNVEVQITPQESTILPVGDYLFKALYSDKKCSYYINVHESRVVRTLSFESSYDVKCAAVDNHISRAFLLAVLDHRAGQLLKLCGEDCVMSQRIKPFFKCEKDVMTVTWPTNRVYPYDVTSSPEALSYALRKRLSQSSLQDAELVILSHNPPLVMPKLNKEGEGVDVVITSSCENSKKTYQKSSDSCI